MACFSINDLTPISTTSGLGSTGNTRKYQQIDVYIYQCERDLGSNNNTQPTSHSFCAFIFCFRLRRIDKLFRCSIYALMSPRGGLVTGMLLNLSPPVSHSPFLITGESSNLRVLDTNIQSVETQIINNTKTVGINVFAFILLIIWL